MYQLRVTPPIASYLKNFITNPNTYIDVPPYCTRVSIPCQTFCTTWTEFQATTGQMNDLFHLLRTIRPDGICSRFVSLATSRGYYWMCAWEWLAYLLDLLIAYSQRGVHPSDNWKLAFVTHRGHEIKLGMTIGNNWLQKDNWKGSQTRYLCNTSLSDHQTKTLSILHLFNQYFSADTQPLHIIATTTFTNGSIYFDTYLEN